MFIIIYNFEKTLNHDLFINIINNNSKDTVFEHIFFMDKNI